jgi:hypothetical protein
MVIGRAKASARIPSDRRSFPGGLLRCRSRRPRRPIMTCTSTVLIPRAILHCISFMAHMLTSTFSPACALSLSHVVRSYWLSYGISIRQSRHSRLPFESSRLMANLCGSFPLVLEDFLCYEGVYLWLGRQLLIGGVFVRCFRCALGRVFTNGPKRPDGSTPLERSTLARVLSSAVYRVTSSKSNATHTSAHRPSVRKSSSQFRALMKFVACVDIGGEDLADSSVVLDCSRLRCGTPMSCAHHHMFSVCWLIVGLVSSRRKSCSRHSMLSRHQDPQLRRHHLNIHVLFETLIIFMATYAWSAEAANQSPFRQVTLPTSGT